MYHDLPPSASFWSFLLTVDEDLAEETRKQGCPGIRRVEMWRGGLGLHSGGWLFRLPVP